MKKSYKLIKIFPGAPKLGSIVKIVGYVNSASLYKCETHCFTISQIENYPEFWEEVVEKDYEILSFLTETDDILIPKIESFRFFVPKDFAWDGNRHRTEEFMLRNPNTYKIHSVKRNDGEIFTVGDKINTIVDKNYQKEIIEINIGTDNFKSYKDKVSFKTKSGYVMLYIAEKIKTPLFQTEDNIDIFEGDEYYYINNSFNDSWGIIHTKADCPSIINKNNLNYKRFSTKEKAEEYVLYNKPLLTLKDVKELLCKNTSSYFLEKFKKRAQKLNNKN